MVHQATLTQWPTQTQTTIFPLTHTHTHSHKHTHTLCAQLQGQGEGSWAQRPEAPGASPAKCQAGTQLGDELRGHRGLPSCTDTLSLEKGRSSQYWAAPGQKGINSQQLTKQATVSGVSALSWDIPHAWFHLASCQSYNIWDSHPILSRRKPSLRRWSHLLRTHEQQMVQWGF